MIPGDDEQKNLFNQFLPTLRRLWELQSRFRPGKPYVEKLAKATKRPHFIRKAERRRKNKAARLARRKNRRAK
jgi:hypothetical protein